jgi:hypothetical protein
MEEKKALQAKTNGGLQFKLPIIEHFHVSLQSPLLYSFSGSIFINKIQAPFFE